MTDEQKQYILDNWNSMTAEALRHSFNEKFGTSYKVTAFQYHTSKMGLRKMPMHHYTEEEDAFLIDNSSKMSRQELTDKFNAEFGTNIDIHAIIARCLRLGANASSDGRFEAGKSPWERCKAGKEFWIQRHKDSAQYNPGCFKKGMISHNSRPVGTEQLRSDGKIYIKVDNGNRWKSKSVVAWEKVHGEILDGYHVMSVNGNTNESDVNNLRLIDNNTQTLLIANRWHDKGSEIFDAGVAYANLYFLLRKEMGLKHYDFKTRMYMPKDCLFD